ncbi:MAG TPA: hypothetical protein VE129_09675 [Thermoanaerobaculia bacterium]|nr:hypothetical protein [Thermoanaerobaculia bacterium]
MKTVRAAGLDSRTTYSFTTPAVRFSELAVPNALGLFSARDGGASLGERLYPERGGPFLISIYPGLLLLVAAVVAWFPRGSPARIWAIPAALGVLLALGPASPLFPALRAFPIFSGIRFPERFLLMTLAALTVSGTCGLARMLEGDPRERRRAALAGAAALLAASSLAVAGGAPAGSVGVRFVRQSAVLALGLGAVAVAVRASGDSVLRVAPAFLLAADLAAVGRPLVGSRPPTELRALPPPVQALLKSPPRGYVFHAAAQDPVRGDLPGMASPPFLAQFGLATALDRDFDLTELAWSTRATGTVLRTVSALPGQAQFLFARRGIAAIVAFRADAPRTLAGARLREASELLMVLAVPAPQPLAFVAEHLVAAAGPAGWSRAVKSAGPSARALAVVDPLDAPWSFPPRVWPGTVVVSSRAASQLVLHVESDGPGPSFVALNQTWDPGWEARLDGAPVPLVRTDLSLSGFLVPPGEHEVILTYRSLPVVVGAGLSLAGLLVTLFAIPRGRRRPS